MSLFTDPNRIPENYGIKIAGALIAFFTVMRLLDFHHHVELRLVNLVFLTLGIYYALKKFKSSHEDHLNYFRGLITGVATGAIGSVLFAAFMFLYMQLDKDLMQSIVDNEPMGHYLNPYIASFIVALEGVFSGMMVTFLLMNSVNTDDVNDPAGESK